MIQIWLKRNLLLKHVGECLKTTLKSFSINMKHVYTMVIPQIARIYRRQNCPTLYNVHKLYCTTYNVQYNTLCLQCTFKFIVQYST